MMSLCPSLERYRKKEAGDDCGRSLGFGLPKDGQGLRTLRRAVERERCSRGGLSAWERIAARYKSSELP